MGKCHKVKCVFKDKVGDNMYFCMFPKCPFVNEEKQEEKDEGNEQTLLSKN